VVSERAGKVSVYPVILIAMGMEWAGELGAFVRARL
jgi:hypothetical protein